MSKTIQIRNLEHKLEKRHNALLAVIQIVGSAAASKQMLHEILHILDKSLELIQGLITLSQWNGHPLIIRITDIGAAPLQVQDSLSTHSAAAAEEAIRTASPVIDSRIHQTIDASKEALSLTLFCVPILMAEQTVGALSVILPPVEEESRPELHRFLNSIAGIISLVLRIHPSKSETSKTSEECSKNDSGFGKLKPQVTRIEEEIIVEALRHAGGRIRQACEDLGITQRILRYKLKKLGIDHKKYFIPKGKRRHETKS